MKPCVQTAVLSKNKLKDDVIKDWRSSSMAECMLSMCEALGLIPKPQLINICLR
jgi:hypothetical protein